MKREQLLLKLLAYRPGLFALVALAWIAASCAPLATGWIERMLFDYLSGHAAIAELSIWVLVALLFGSQALGSAILVGWLYLHVVWENTLETLVHKNMIAWLLQHTRTRPLLSTGEAISRFDDDVWHISDLVNEWYRLLGEGIFAVAALSIMAHIDPLITLSTALPLAAIVILIHKLNARIGAYFESERRATSAVAGFVGELFGAIQAVKLATAEADVLKRVRTLNSVRHNAALRSASFAAVVSALGDNIFVLSRGLILFLAARSMHAGTFTVGDFMLFATYLGAALEFPRRIGRLLAARKTAKISLERIETLLCDAPAYEISRAGPVYLSGALPELPSIQRAPDDVLTTLEISDLRVSSRRKWHRRDGCRPLTCARLFYSHYRTRRCGKDYLIEIPARFVAAGRRRGALE